MARMTVVQVPTPGAAFEVVEREIPSPSAGTLRIKVEACGLCERLPLARAAEAYDRTMPKEMTPFKPGETTRW